MSLVPDPRVAGWRELIAAGTITPEDYKLAVEYLRAGRKAAAELAAVKKKAAAGKGKRKKVTEKESGDGERDGDGSGVAEGGGVRLREGENPVVVASK